MRDNAVRATAVGKSCVLKRGSGDLLAAGTCSAAIVMYSFHRPLHHTQKRSPSGNGEVGHKTNAFGAKWFQGWNANLRVTKKRRPAQGDNWAGRAFDTVVDEARRVGRISTYVD